MCEIKDRMPSLTNALWLTTFWTSPRLCSWTTEPLHNAPFILNHDATSCHQWTCLPVERCKQVSFEHSKTSPILCCLCQTCLKHVAVIKLLLNYFYYTIRLLVKPLRQRKTPWITPGNIQGLDIEMVVKYKYHVVHLNNKLVLDW